LRYIQIGVWLRVKPERELGWRDPTFPAAVCNPGSGNSTRYGVGVPVGILDVVLSGI
jgi:hypothetical protein